MPAAPQADGSRPAGTLVPTAAIRVSLGTEGARPWATFQFTAASGRTNECDVLIAVPGGLYLLELKGHPGRVVNHGDTWCSFHGYRVRTLRSPLNRGGRRWRMRGQA